MKRVRSPAASKKTIVTGHESVASTIQESEAYKIVGPFLPKTMFKSEEIVKAYLEKANSPPWPGQGEHWGRNHADWVAELRHCIRALEYSFQYCAPHNEYGCGAPIYIACEEYMRILVASMRALFNTNDTFVVRYVVKLKNTSSNTPSALRPKSTSRPQCAIVKKPGDWILFYDNSDLRNISFVHDSLSAKQKRLSCVGRKR